MQPVPDLQLPRDMIFFYLVILLSNNFSLALLRLTVHTSLGCASLWLFFLRYRENATGVVVQLDSQGIMRPPVTGVRVVRRLHLTRTATRQERIGNLSVRVDNPVSFSRNRRSAIPPWDIDAWAFTNLLHISCIYFYRLQEKRDERMKFIKCVRGSYKIFFSFSLV